MFRPFRLERECKIQMLALSAAPNGIKPIPVNHEEAVYTYNYTGREEAALVFAQVSVSSISCLRPVHSLSNSLPFRCRCSPQPYFEMLDVECGDAYKQ